MAEHDAAPESDADDDEWMEARAGLALLRGMIDADRDVALLRDAAERAIRAYERAVLSAHLGKVFGAQIVLVSDEEFKSSDAWLDAWDPSREAPVETVPSEAPKRLACLPSVDGKALQHEADAMVAQLETWRSRIPLPWGSSDGLPFDGLTKSERFLLRANQMYGRRAIAAFIGECHPSDVTEAQDDRLRQGISKARARARELGLDPGKSFRQRNDGGDGGDDTL